MARTVSKYEKYILQAAEEFYRENNQRPRKNDYSIRVAKLINEAQNEMKVKEAQVRPQVSRIIDNISGGTDNKLLCLSGKYYVLNKEEYLVELLSESYYSFLKGKISVKSKDVLKISENMCAILVEPIKQAERECEVPEVNSELQDTVNASGDELHSQILELNKRIAQLEEKLKRVTESEPRIEMDKVFVECLGDDCFEVLDCTPLILIFIKGDSDNASDMNEGTAKKISRSTYVMEALKNTITRIYSEENRIKLKPRKTKKIAPATNP